MAQAQATLRRRILRALVGWGLLESFKTKEMLGCQHNGFSVDAGVCIQAHDRASPARVPPLWDDCDAQVGEGTQIEPDWDLGSRPSPDFDVDQRVNW